MPYEGKNYSLRLVWDTFIKIISSQLEKRFPGNYEKIFLETIKKNFFHILLFYLFIFIFYFVFCPP